jgi:hypothetical protein
LISRVLLFIKIFSLRSSLMPAIKDKCVVIPLDGRDVINTVESLPRLPSESGIIDVQWKRRVGQKNSHLQAKVDPTKIFKALQFLRDCGNKHYASTQNREEYEQRCQNEDPEGFNLVFGKDPEFTELDDKPKLKFIPDDYAEPMVILETYREMNELHRLEQQYREEDPIRKYQIDYDESICMVEKFPEAMQIEGVIGQSVEAEEAAIAGDGHQNQLFVIAPGEGKTPINLTYCEDWDAKAFPMLHPDGQNHLTDRRRQKLADVDYFKQRLCNKDPRWRNHPHWVFAAAVFKEKKDFQRNIDLGYKKGKKNTSSGGKTVYSLADPYSVFQSVANTPAYHKKGKMEMMARLDNQGPFHVFFTVSCADTRWKENLISVLREHDKSVRCIIDNDQVEMYEILSSSGQWITLESYLEKEMDETLHEVLRRNVVTATRNYQARVQALMQEIVRHPSNPLSVKHFASKLEFQARGAGHNHGVLWLDIDKIEQKVDIRQLKQDNNYNLEKDHYLKDPMQVQEIDNFLTDRGYKPDKTKNRKRMHKALRYLKRLKEIKQKTHLTDDHQKDIEDLQHFFISMG